MRVDEGRQQVAPVAVDGLRAGRGRQRAGRADLRDLAVAHEHVVQAVEAGARIQRVDVAQEQVRGPGGRADEADAGRDAAAW